MAIVDDASGTIAVQLRPRGAPGLVAVTVMEPTLPTAEVGDEDVRILSVKWRGERRFRPFAEWVDLMSHHDFADTELEGDVSCEWYLNKIVQTGMTPIARHRAWVSENSIPADDRSVHEHHFVMMTLQVAAERDQLNCFMLEVLTLTVRSTPTTPMRRT